MGFTWECDGNTFEEKGMIEDSLPEGFTYKTVAVALYIPGPWCPFAYT